MHTIALWLPSMTLTLFNQGQGHIVININKKKCGGGGPYGVLHVVHIGHSPPGGVNFYIHVSFTCTCILHWWLLSNKAAKMI